MKGSAVEHRVERTTTLWRSDLGNDGHHGNHGIVLIEGTRLRFLPNGADCYEEKRTIVFSSHTVCYGDYVNGCGCTIVGGASGGKPPERSLLTLSSAHGGNSAYDIAFDGGRLNDGGGGLRMVDTLAPGASLLMMEVPPAAPELPA